MGDVDDEVLALRNIAHRMSQGIEIKTRSYGMLQFRNVFLGKDAVEWLLADPRSGVVDLDGAIQMGQRMIEEGYVLRVSRELRAQELRHFGKQQKAKRHFRSGDAIYRFDNLRISPFLLHVVVQQARNLSPHDLNGKNDPYVKLRLGQQSAMTRVQLKTNNPVWDEHFVFGVSSVEAQQLHLTVYDYDRYKHDDLVGTCHIGLSHLPVEEAGDSALGTESLSASIVDYANTSAAGGNGTGVDLGYVGEVNHPMFDGEHGEDGERRHDSLLETRSLTCAATESGTSEMSLRRSSLSTSGGRSHHSDQGILDWADTMSHHDETSSLFSGIGIRGRKREKSGSAGSISPGITPKRRAGMVRSVTPWGKKRGNLLTTFADVGHDVTRRANGSPLHGSDEAIKFYPLDSGSDSLFCSRDKRGLKGEMKSDASSQETKTPPQELGCDIWLTSFRPRPLPVQGEARFTLRCRLWEMSGVTSPEGRNIVNINSNVIKHKAVLMLNGDRVLSASCERNKDKRTLFNGTLVSLDTKANMATDMLKFVVQQKNASVELVYKPVGTVSVPLRSIPVIFPGDASSVAALTAEAVESSDSSHGLPIAGMGESTHAKTGGGSDSLRRRGRSIFGGSSGSDRTSRKALTGNVVEDGPLKKTACPGEPRPRKYRLQTLAGPFTSRTMDNGFVMMSLMLVPSGNDLLGEQEPADGEPLEGPPPEVPKSLTFPCLDAPIKCGYQRLRKAILWHDSKLMAALAERLNHKEVTATPWLDKDGETGHQEDMTDCKRERSFVLPKTAIAASNKAEAEDVMILDGPSVMSFDSRVRTPEVPFGDKFEVLIRFVLVKEGPEKCRLSTSSQARFTGQLLSLIQNQITSAVPKATKEEHKTLLELIEEALSGNGPGAGAGKGSGRGTNKGSGRACRWCIGALFVVVTTALLSWLALAWGVVEAPRVFDDARRLQARFGDSKAEVEQEAEACDAGITSLSKAAVCGGDIDGAVASGAGDGLPLESADIVATADALGAEGERGGDENHDEG